MAPVARGLADSFQVLEPLQRGSGGDPLTVARHVADLYELLDAHCQSTRPALVGSSWGAMLALAYGAAHPDRTGPIALIGCGTFDEASRRELESTRDERMDETLRQRIANLEDEFPNPDEALRALGDLLLPLYSYELVTTDLEIERCDARAYRETWEDMVRLQEEGVYPAAFAAIDSPVLMLHGTVDPHPGRMIRASLKPHLPQLNYIEWERCGHYPWLEKAIRDEFFKVLNGWLSQQLALETN
jgi:pimeloyl-ACP methyl ester carboxylesterase